MKMSFNYDANKTYFHNKGFALSLVLKVRFFGTRKWPIQEVNVDALNILKGEANQLAEKKKKKKNRKNDGKKAYN